MTGADNRIPQPAAVHCDFVSVLVLSGETDAEMAEQSDIKTDIVLDAVRDIPALLD